MRGAKRFWIRIVVMAAFFFCITSSITTTAQEMDETSEKANSEQETIKQEETADFDTLVLDDSCIYSGMKAAYKNGYTPTVSGNTVQIVLPVYFKNDSEVNSIQAGLDLGAVDDSPFDYKNYSKTVKKSKEKPQNSKEEKEVFLVKFKIGLNADRINGIYPVVIKLYYSLGDIEMTQEFTVYVTIENGRSISGQEAQTEEQPSPTSDPRLIVVKNKLSTDKILSGSDFTDTVILKNTNKDKHIQNITVTVSCESENVSLCGETNVFYYDKLEADDVLELPLEFMVDEKASEGKYIVKLFFSYDDPQAASLSSEGEFYFRVYQKMRVGLETGEVTEQINAGDSISLPIQVMNLGRGTIYNVRCNVEGTGLTASQSLFIGNLEGGTAGSGELVLFAGMVNANAEDEAERYGSAYGNIVMTYEDEEGNSYTEEQEYSTNISPIKIKSSESDVVKDESTIGKQLVAGVIFLLAVIGISIVIQTRHKGKGAESGESDV